jgi:hypothetical protein
VSDQTLPGSVPAFSDAAAARIKLAYGLGGAAASLGYVYGHTISLTAAYFSVYGSADALQFGSTSLANSPDGQGLIFDPAYLPFSKGAGRGYGLGQCAHRRLLHALSKTLWGSEQF